MLGSLQSMIFHNFTAIKNLFDLNSVFICYQYHIMKVKLITKSSVNNSHFRESLKEGSSSIIQSKIDDFSGVIEKMMDNMLRSEEVLKKLDQNQKVHHEILKGITQKITDSSFLSMQQSEHPHQEGIRIKLNNVLEVNSYLAKHSNIFSSLDARDKVIYFAFNIESQISLEPNKLFFEANFDLENKIKDYLVEMVETVVSVSFNYLSEMKLQDNESKAYASKNILLNVKELCETFAQVLKQEIFHFRSDQIKDIKLEMTALVDITLKEIFSNISPYYPQAPPCQVSSRLREMILDIDRSNNQELDFLVTQNLIMNVQRDGNYIPYIMTVINRALEITKKTEDKDKYASLKDKFVSFNQILFWLSKQEIAAEKINQIERCREQKFTDRSAASFGRVNSNDRSPNKTQMNLSLAENLPLQQKLMKVLKQSYKEQTFCYEIFKEDLETSNKFQERKQKEIDLMKKQKQFVTGQKLHSSIKPFTAKQIQQSAFYSKHASMMRLLTKWAQNLEQIFNYPERYTINRQYPFKTFDNETYNPENQKIKSDFFNKIIEKKVQLKKIKQQLLSENTYYECQFLSEKDCQGSMTNLLKRYTKVRIAASKINVLEVHLMSRYVSKLIHLLVTISSEVAAVTDFEHRHFVKNVNLATFRIADLMRSKIHCDEGTFIRLMKLIYLLDDYCEDKINKNKDFFKLVQIKNKLDSKDSNILLTYLFQEEVICELQISVQKWKTKQQNYYSFNHFIYQLTRGKFGALSELSTIITQHDPIAAASNTGIYSVVSQKISKQFQQIKALTKNKISNIDENFICISCKKFRISENCTLFEEKFFENANKKCNQCLIGQIKSYKKENIENYFVPKYKWIQNAKKNQYILPINLQNLEKKSSLMLTLNKKNGNIKILIIFFLDKQFIWYSSWVKPQFYKIKEQNEDNIALNKFENCENKQDLLFYQILWNNSNVNIFSKMPEVLLLTEVNLTKERVKENLKAVELRINKQHVKKLVLNRSQSLQFSDRQKSSIFLYDMIRNNQIKLKHIQFLYLSNIKLHSVPRWLYKCEKLKILNMEGNQIQEADISQLTTLEQLNLRNNPLEKLDLSNLEGLQKLYIQTVWPATLDVVGIDFRNFQNLKVLSLSRSSIQLLRFENLASLKEIYIKKNLSSSLTLRKLPKLEIACIQGNTKLEDITLEGLPSTKWIRLKDQSSIAFFKIEDVPSIKRFDLKEDVVCEQLCQRFIEEQQQKIIIGDQIKIQTQLRFIKHLVIKKIAIKQICLKGYELLAEVAICENNILEQLELKDLICLKTINIHSNKVLKKIKLSNLPVLSNTQLISNAIREFEFDSLESVVYLNISGNNIQSLKLLSLLNKLEKLDVSNNPLKELKISTNHLMRLTLNHVPQLKLYGNDIDLKVTQSQRNVLKACLFTEDNKCQVYYDGQDQQIIEYLNEKFGSIETDKYKSENSINYD